MKGSFTNFRKQVEKNYREVKVRQLYPYPNNLPPTSTDGIDQLDEYRTSRGTLRDLDFKDFELHPNADFDITGGEDAANDHLQDFISRALATYKQTRNGLQGKYYSSHLQTNAQWASGKILF